MSFDVNPLTVDNRSYLGNSLIKRAGVAVEWTPDAIIEYQKCAADPVYFIEKYIKVVTLDHGLKTIKLYGYQKELIEALHKQRFVIANTARQSGKSTTISAFICWYVIFNPGKTVGVLSKEESAVKEVMFRIQTAYENIPKWLQQGVVEWNKRSFVLENDSRVKTSTTSRSAFRGDSINFLYIDEAAHIERWGDIAASVMPTINSGESTKICMTSTPNGLNHFWNYWENAVKGKNGYYWVEVPWQKVPMANGRLRDEAWKQKALADLNFDMEKFRQENECQFLGSSGTLIAGWKLQQLEHQVPIATRANFSQYEGPQKGHAYVISADVSEGRGLDYSAFHVIDITKIPYKQVAVFHDNLITPYDYAETIFQVAKSYNNAYVLVETNGIGQQVSDSIYFDFEYEYLFVTEAAGRLGRKISSGFGAKVDRGVKTTKTVKAVGCAITKLLIEQDKLILNDGETIFEFSTFSRGDKKTYEAEEGKHDDLVMGIILFGWLSDQAFFQELNNVNTLAALREKTHTQLMDDLSPFGFIDDGKNLEVATEINDISVGGDNPEDWFGKKHGWND